MTAGDRRFSGAGIFYSNARTVTDPFFDLGATFVGKTRVDRRPAGKAVFIPLENLQDFCIERVWGERLLQGAADLLGDRPFDAHAFDEEVVVFILLDRV